MPRWSSRLLKRHGTCHLNNVQTSLGDDRRNVPCTAPQLCCIPCSSSGGAVGQPRHSCQVRYSQRRRNLPLRNVCRRGEDSQIFYQHVPDEEREHDCSRQQVTHEVSSRRTVTSQLVSCILLGIKSIPPPRLHEGPRTLLFP